jgi:uncharacterized SAM-binding protein YcdF (DUF218 family)
MAKILFRLLLHRVFLILVILFSVALSFFLKERARLTSGPISSWDTEPKADCAVVLTGGAGRVKEGFDLLAHKAIKKLIIAGVYPNTSLREIFPMLPFYGDLREEDVFLERRSGTTYGNAQQALPIVEALHCRDIVLVTSRLHMPRAYQTFRATFPEKVSIYRHSIVPSQGESGNWEIGTEILKNLFYSLWAY